ncbi:MAG TPA: FAD-linked oxidase C-terminal domain-containing protein [Actinomycetota bacterium]
MAELGRVLPQGALATDPDVVEGYRHDQASFVDAGTPLAVVHAGGAGEVQELLRLAARHRVPVVPRGAGSGLSGGANAVDGGVVLSLARMNRILEIDRRSLLAVVEPGVVTADLARAAAEAGLCYPPDPASAAFSTVGGNIATNAGGLCCVKYGVTRDFVLGLDVVLADGSLLRTGRRTVKGVAGYDLTSLFVGSEGTLGVVTRATLQLRPPPPPPATLVAFFPSLRSAGVAIAGIVSAVVPSLLELMDRTTVRAVEDYKRMDLDVDAAALLLARSDAGPEQGLAETGRMARICEEAGAAFVARSSDPAEGELLMTARRLAFPALERMGPVLLDDVAVPIGRIPELLEAIEAIAAEARVVIGTFGHAGDGNMHPTIVSDPADPASGGRARWAFEEILRAALELGGTITGEHGVGLLKRPFLEAEIGAAGAALHAAVKQALDPTNILNPGKALV